MRNLCLFLGLVIGTVAGCATPPPADPVASRAMHDITLASASLEVENSATLPVEENLEGSHDIDFYVRLALERNPQILAAQRGVAAQTEVIPQVTALDDPILTETFQPITSNSVQTAAGRGVNALTVSQRFPWLSKLRVRGEVAEQETQMAITRLAQSELKVVEDIKLSYYELYFNQGAIAITVEDEKLLQDLIKFAVARYKTGQTSQQDVLRAQVELENLRNLLIVLRQKFRQAQADLAKELHTSPEADLQAKSIEPNIAPRQIEQLYDAAVRCRPELQERLYALVRDQRATELAKLNYYPDFNVGVGWQAITANNALSGVANGNDNVAFTVGVSLPIWRDKLRAGVRESEHRLVEDARRYDGERDETFRRIKRLIVQVRAQEEQIKLFRDSIVPKSIQTLRVSTADYRVGKVDFQQIIDNWSDLLRFQTQLIRLEANLGQTLASLERVIGCQLATLDETSPSPSPALVPPAPADSNVPPKQEPKPAPKLNEQAANVPSTPRNQ